MTRKNIKEKSMVNHEGLHTIIIDISYTKRTADALPAFQKGMGTLLKDFCPLVRVG